MRKVQKNGVTHYHPDSQTEADGTPNMLKQGENTYVCALCNETLVLTR